MIDIVLKAMADSYWPLILAGALYIGQMIAYLRQNEVGMAVTFGAYALANFGLVLDYIKRFN